MQDFLRLLADSYQRVLPFLPDASPTRTRYRQRLDQILLAESALLKQELLNSHPDFPVQLAVIGPTQSGKSTLVNLLQSSEDAGVSPLASYTAHAHGFMSPGTLEAAAAGIRTFFAGFEEQPRQQLQGSDTPDAYSLSDSLVNSTFDLQQTVLWDTPDFDSVNAEGYSNSLLHCCGLADAIVLIVSKDKYSDQTVWDMLKMLVPLQQPTLVCINKLDPADRDTVEAAFLREWHSHREDQPDAIIKLNYRKQGQQPWPAAEDRKSLSSAISRIQKKNRRKQQAAKASVLITQHWHPWTEPVRQELQDRRAWENLVEQHVQECLERYKRDFLNHPQHYETFQQALLRLLELLEIPALAKPLGYTRKVVSWPVNQVRKAWRRQRYPEVSDEAMQSQEVKILQQQFQHLNTALGDAIIRRSRETGAREEWWRLLNSRLRATGKHLSAEFDAAIREYRLEFQPEIEASANRLYIKLQSEPRLLNSLRATRATGDLGAVILALKTGGIGVQDLILTPMMLSVSTLLAETAMGTAMKQETRHLKEQQYKRVSEELFEHTLRQKLLAIPLAIETDTQFNISEEKLDNADKWLKKQHG